MPDLNETRELLEQTFITGWASTTPLAHENLDYQDTNVSYVEIRFINYLTYNVNIGSVENKKKRHEGVLSLKIHVKMNTGIKEAYDLADQIGSIMDNIILSNLFTNSCDTRRGGETESGYYTVIVDCPYVSDE